MTSWRVSMHSHCGLSPTSRKIFYSSGTLKVCRRQISRECWQAAEAGSWRRTTAVAFLEPSDWGELASGFVDFCWSQSCQKKKEISPTKRPLRRPAPPSLASLSSTSEAFRSCATLPATGTPSGLSVPTRQTSWSPPILKQVSDTHSFGGIFACLMKSIPGTCNFEHLYVHFGQNRIYFYAMVIFW